MMLHLSRRDMMTCSASAATLAAVGCVGSGSAGRTNLVWGRRGTSDGRFLKPRAITIDPQDQLYIVDTTGRIQVFDVDGRHLRTWTTPQTTNGRPTGLSFQRRRNPDGSPVKDRLLVADTHYYRMLAYRPSGELIESAQIGGEAGYEPGQFAFVTDATTDERGRIYIGEYGDSDRIQSFDAEGNFLCQWGGTGRDWEQFLRPQSLVVDGKNLWIVDACNHRLQCYDLSGDRPVWKCGFGDEGNQPGQFYYPYDLVVDVDGTLLVCEYGNQRIQRLSPQGDPIASWGGPGRAVGQLYQPWGMTMDSQRRLHVLDSNNHRVQRIHMPG